MLEQIRVPFGAERHQHEILVAPLKKEHVRNDALPRYGKPSPSSITNHFNGSAGYNAKSVIAGLEKKRSDLFSLALKAVARAQADRERCNEAENRLERETNQRLVAEERLRVLERDRLRQLQSMKIEGAKTLKAMLAHGEVRARLIEAEGRIKEAENDAKSLSLALARADQKRAQAEATARAAEEKANKIEALFLGDGAAAQQAAERNLVFGFLVYENKKQEMLGNGGAVRKNEGKRSLKADFLRNFRKTKSAKPSLMPEPAPLAESKFTTSRLPRSVNNLNTNRLKGRKAFGINPKFIVVGTVITLVLVGVCWLLSATFL